MNHKIERRLIFGMAILALACLLCSLCGSVAWSDDAYAPGDQVMISVDDAPLSAVVKMLSDRSTIPIVMAATPEEAQRRVSVHVDGQPVEKVLKDILAAARVSYRKTEDGTYLIGAANEPEPVELRTLAAAPVPTPIIEQQAPLTKTRWEVVKLRNRDASELVDTLMYAPSYDTDEPYYPIPPSQRYVGDIEHPRDSYSGGVYIREPSTHTEAVPPTQDINSYVRRNLNEGGRTPGDYAAAGQFPSSRSGSSGYPRPTTGSSSSSSRTPGTTGGSPGSGGLLPDGIELVKALDIDNSIIVRGDEPGISQLKELIHMLDVPPRQVQIEAQFIEVSTSVIKNLGINWSMDRLNSTFSNTFPLKGNVIVGVTAGNVMAQLKAELTAGKGKIINAPKISTINNMWAEIQIRQNIPLFLTNIVSTGQGSVVSGTTVTYRPVDTGLSVLPRINGDDSVTMFIRPTVSDTGRDYTSGDPTNPQTVPEERTQFLQTNRRVMNGETIVLGGFVRREDTSEVHKVPILGDLPLIGGLFRNKTSDAQDRELLIFLTPTIIPERGGSATGVRPAL